MAPLVSILLPCYNAETYLEEALLSILDQSYDNIEILCIDDGSSDQTIDILNQYARTDSRMRIERNNENQGLIYTLNKGIALANGSLLARMDADDISFPDRVEKQVEFLEEHPDVALISSGYKAINGDGKNIGTFIPAMTTPDACAFATLFITPIVHPLMMGRTQVLKSVGYSTADYSLHNEDYEMWSRMVRMGYKIANLSMVLGKVRYNESSVSRKFENIQIKNFSLSAWIHYKEFLQKDIDKEAHKVVVNRMNAGISTLKWREGQGILKNIKNVFMEIREDADRDSLKEIDEVIMRQRLDVLIQSVKKLNNDIKIMAIIEFLGTPAFYLKKSLLRYLISKY